ncbi:NAD(P)H-dependent oxidoreductase [Massilibacteroides sp.]|uniref:NAD(P)H-dependent oxidoreductase n=1 Tax=Massilibacteroides sp. TaxID=2034766 RepID=UPI00260C94FA|nr:NAD(P)H-dependent oxidoreductase [Massilibacteroides sp.]MDD4514644.1 NAD(P)H-dependent oxidoreductase [Massilibacteroides sp.]
MKTIIILAHPNIESSVVNKKWIDALAKSNPEVTVHNLYQTYPDWKINVDAEQQLLAQHDRIIFEYPVYWFNMPPLLKKWFDEVLTYGWAYGPKYSLEGKEFGVAISTGGVEDAYKAGGADSYPITTFISQIEASAKYLHANYHSYHVFHGALSSDATERLEENAKAFVKFVTAV